MKLPRLSGFPTLFFLLFFKFLLLNREGFRGEKKRLLGLVCWTMHCFYSSFNVVSRPQRTVRDGEPRTATSTFTPELWIVFIFVCSFIRNEMSCTIRGVCVCVCVCVCACMRACMCVCLPVSAWERSFSLLLAWYFSVEGACGGGGGGGWGGLQVSRVLAVLANRYGDGLLCQWSVTGRVACRWDFDVALMATASSTFVTRCEWRCHSQTYRMAYLVSLSLCLFISLRMSLSLSVCLSQPAFPCLCLSVCLSGMRRILKWCVLTFGGVCAS